MQSFNVSLIVLTIIDPLSTHLQNFHSSNSCKIFLKNIADDYIYKQAKFHRFIYIICYTHHDATTFKVSALKLTAHSPTMTKQKGGMTR